MIRRMSGQLFFLIGAIFMIVMSLKYFFASDIGILKNKEIASSGIYIFILRVHITGGLLAIFIGALQMIDGIRKVSISFHKGLGKIYVFTVFVSSISGLIIAQYAMGGIITEIGFSVLATVWFVCTYNGYKSIRNGLVIKHKQWMYRSYALTFAAITQRTLLLVPLLTNIDFFLIYKISAWFPWIFNLLVAEYIVRKNGRTINKEA